MFQRAYVEITNVCNLRCSFCPGTAREKKFLDPADFRVLAEKLRPWTDYLYLHVMGEPLLHPALGEILDICDALGLRVCVTTNGVLLPSRLGELPGAGGGGRDLRPAAVERTRRGPAERAGAGPIVPAGRGAGGGPAH